MATTQKIEVFYNELKNIQAEVNRARSKTIASRGFKESAVQAYEKWLKEIQPTLEKSNIKGVSHSNLNSSFEVLNSMAAMRVAEVSKVKTTMNDILSRFFKEVIVNLKKNEFIEPTANLIESAHFLGLNDNWSVATCALQLQEVSIKLVAKKTGLNLDRVNVEKILRKKIEPKDFSFNQQYEAFAQRIKESHNIDMPILTTHLRRMRVKVLHEGYNPEPEEKDSIESFTIGLLKKLECIN